ncbi:radical SAM-linked protein [Actinoalloteichus hoggarensis]|nr:radical SAM-linked protein [Actinoalloteichus hoggarensis]
MARSVERALRRAGVPMAYSKGFNPHPKVSWAGAAPTGAASEAEYVELALVERVDPSILGRELNAALPPGLDIVDVVEAGPGSLADRLTASIWRIEVPGVDPELLRDATRRMLAEPVVEVERMTKNGRRTIDARAAIVGAEVYSSAAASPPEVLVEPEKSLEPKKSAAAGVTAAEEATAALDAAAAPGVAADSASSDTTAPPVVSDDATCPVHPADSTLATRPMAASAPRRDEHLTALVDDDSPQAPASTNGVLAGPGRPPMVEQTRESCTQSDESVARRAGTADRRSVERPYGILVVVVRQVTPTVRPDDVLSALRVVAAVEPPVPAKATRMAQGRLDDDGRLVDPLTADRAVARPGVG